MFMFEIEFPDEKQSVGIVKYVGEQRDSHEVEGCGEGIVEFSLAPE